MGKALINFRRALPMLWRASPRWSLWSMLAMLCEVGFGLAVLYVIKRLVDAVTGLVGIDSASGDGLLFLVGLAAVLTAALLAARSLSTLAREAQGLEVADYLDRRIHGTALDADLAFYESPRYFDTLRRARQYGRQRPMQLTANLVGFARNGLMMIGICVLLLSINWMLLPLLIVMIVPALLVRMYFTRFMYEWQRERTQLDRRSGYLDWLVTSDTTAKEMRLGGLGRYFSDRFRRIRGRIRREQLRIGRLRTVSELLVALIGSAAFFGALAFLTVQTARGNTSVGDLAMFLLIFQRAQSLGQETVRQVSSLYEDHLYLGFLFDFLSIEPRVQSPDEPEPVPDSPATGIRFEGVGFRYRDGSPEVLSDIDLEMPPGRITALVGANGSGKTSLVKLLCRLYDPTAGRITFDGIDIRHFDLNEYRRCFGVLFQDFGRFADTVAENIRFGDLRLDGNDPALQEAAQSAGAAEFIERLRNGYETRLTRMFDEGEQVSVGQWQRIALARALVSPSQYLVLDEPSSSLDPQAEFELFRDFRQILGHRGALLISHRLSTVRLADCIHVLDNGRLVESGSHEELMDKGGVYERLFCRQAGGYLEVKGER